MGQAVTLTDITKRDVLALLDGIVERGAVVRARRVFATLAASSSGVSSATSSPSTQWRESSARTSAARKPATVC